MSAGTVTIVVTPAGGTNWEGDPTGAGDSFSIDGCKRFPESTREDTTRGETVVFSAGVWLPPGSPRVDELATVEIPPGSIQGTWQVVSAQQYENGRGKDKGTILRLRKRGTKT